MNDDGFDLGDDTRRAASQAWFDYLEFLDPFRPDLFRYCRRLTGDPWEAEDLVQDTVEQGFAKLASVHHQIQHPRAYILRIASNLWVDRLRRRHTEAGILERTAQDPTREPFALPSADRGISVRDAGSVLLGRLAPKERAALLLKDVFDLSLEETASILRTSIGAVKSALHRGRERLREPMEDGITTSQRPTPAAEAVEQFVARYNARDLPGLLELMLDGATIEMHGHVYEAGREGFERKDGWFHHNFFNPLDGSPSEAVWKIAEFRSEPVVLVLSDSGPEASLSSVMRFEASGGKVAGIRVYALCPDVVAEVAEELGLKPSPLRMYRFPLRVT